MQPAEKVTHKLAVTGGKLREKLGQKWRDKVKTEEGVIDSRPKPGHET